MTTAATPETADDLRSLKTDFIADLLEELAELNEKASSGDVAVFELLPITATFDLREDRAVSQLEETLNYLLAAVRNARNRVRAVRRNGTFPK